jgi:hypothetical protein
MADPRQLVESIRGFIRAEGSVIGAPVASTAAEYAEMCRETNVRLKRCADFLHEGLIGEAVEFAAARPPLLDLIATLDFQEAPDWDRMCEQMSLARAERLELNTSIILHAAKERYEPIRELLGKYRYLALARSPLGERLAVAWQLAAADPASVIWQEEAEELEKSRLIQLRSDAAAAIDGNDAKQMDRLLAELGAGGWRSLGAAELKENLTRSVAAIRYGWAITELNALAPKVREAYAARSFEQCQSLFAQWGKIVKESRIQVPLNLRQEIMPVAKWIDEEDDRRILDRKFRAACALLLQAVQTDAPVEEIKRLYQAVTAFELELPDEVSTAYRRSVDAARKAKLKEQRTQYALAAGLVGVIVAALGALTWVIVNGGKH